MKYNIINYRIIAPMSLLILIFFWSPWLVLNEKNTIKKLQATDGYARDMDRVSRSIHCDKLSTKWSPFGRKIKYCDRAEWYLSFWGGIFSDSIVEYSRDKVKEDRAKRFDFYINGDKDDFCNNWNASNPIVTTAKLISLTAPDKNASRNLAVLRFQREEREQNFLFPYEKMDMDDYKIGGLYEIDLNNVCIYYSLTPDIADSKYRDEFTLPKPINKN